MKKFSVLFVLICLLTGSIALAGISRTSVSWYTRPTSDNSRPPAPAEAPFLEENDAFYLGKDEKKVYLTFDLGYENENVFTILDALKKHNAPAAFFVLAHEVENGKAIERLINEGHLICNHTSHHPDMSKLLDKEAFRIELESLEEKYTSKTGEKMAKYYRPPQGIFSEQNLVWAKELGYKTVFWSLTWADWDNSNQLPPEKAMDKLMSRLHNGAIILLHPISDTNAKMMDEFLTRLEKEGYSFGSLDEL
ncbi:MAG: polysaccharide deacetylase family protein [Clostridia bacterium]|nr:polysaccharide deacetylase family protein [Clostridia bacterium]